MNINKTIIPLSLILLCTAGGCNMDDKDKDYTDWKKQNEQYFDEQKALRADDGNLYYNYEAPVWAPEAGVLRRWHVRNPKHAEMLKPLSNSTVTVKYEGRLCDGSIFDSSYTKQDSAYTCRPSALVSGFWSTLTEMVPGDSVTVVIPPVAGYGAVLHGNIKPFSVLVFDIKMKSIDSYYK